MIARRLRSVALTLLGLATAVTAGVVPAHGQTGPTVFINEIHYDNDGTDTGEALEIAGPAGTDLSGWQIVRYNGSTPAAAMVYTSPVALETLPSGTLIPNLCGGFGVVVINYPTNGLQNGPNDGFALVNASGVVVQFLSYEGTITAANGPAAGATSTDIGVLEPGATLAGRSLQLQGTGSRYGDFAWSAEILNTLGACNTAQIFTAGADTPPSVAQTVPADGSTGVAPESFISVTFSEAVTADASAFSIVCGAESLAFTLIALNAHVVGLIELENNATASLQDLVDGLNAATQPGRYAFIDTGSIGTDAIKVGLIYQPGVVSPVGPFGLLDAAADPRAITTLNRPALAQTFLRKGSRSNLQHFTVVVNHFKSKGSACTTPQNPGELTDPDGGDGQGNCNLTRVSMAQALIDWLADNPTGDPTPAARRKVLIIGDLNAYAREHPIRALTDPTFTLPGFPANPNAEYTNLVERFLGDEAYSFVFQGQSGYLDHALANPALTPLVTGLTEWHINADEPVALDYNVEWTATIMKTATQQATLYAPDPFRSADHDPLVVGLNPLCGDLDDDGDVDVRDRRRMLAALASRADDPRADYTLDGRVTLRDFGIWVRCELEFGLGRFLPGQ